jgi:ParB-like nuclease domain
MGAVKKLLAGKTLKEREKHNSRALVDLCENIHIHYREFRLIFSLDEYFEFVNIVNKSTQDVRNYLYNNPEYKEREYPTTIMIACGKDRQRKFLENSPQPHRSTYHNNHFAIELQEEFVTDEIHVHWRDLRIALNRENFKDVAEAFIEAHQNLTDFERKYAYQRAPHTDRDIIDFNSHKQLDGERVQGTVLLDLEKIASFWFKDLQSEWKPNRAYIENLKARFASKEPVPPLIVSKPNGDGIHTIVNGHHRYLAAREAGLAQVEVVVLPLGFEETEELRQAESLLKQFDKRTGYEHGLTAFLNDYMAFKFNRFYRNDFQRQLRKIHRSPLSKVRRALRSFVKLFEDPLRRLRKRRAAAEPQHKVHPPRTATSGSTKKSQAA